MLFLASGSEAEKLVLEVNGYAGLGTVAVRPFSIYGEGDRLQVHLSAVSRLYLPGDHQGAFCYVRNLVRWHLLADKGLETKPEVVGGQAYFVADNNEQTMTLTQFAFMIAEGAQVKISPLSTILFKTIAYTTPVLDWLSCGRFNYTILNTGPSSVLYACNEARFDISKGVRDLGYTTRYDYEAVKENLRRFYAKK